jgi:UDP-N-acetylglucosamine:LPS N-acetylglucosamine transferase
MLASTKYLRRQNIGVDKMLASTKCWCQQNTCTDKILASALKILLLFGWAESTAADFSQTLLKISFFSLMVLFSLHVVTKCGVASARSAFMADSTVLYRLIVPARHAENVKKFGAAKLSASA